MHWLIEDYLHARGVQYFRGHHDDEYFFLVDFLTGAQRGAYRSRLNVHLEVCDVDRDAVLLTVSPDRYYPAAQHDGLSRLVDRWNAGTSAVQAVVHGSCDPALVGVTARGRCTPADLAELTGFVDDAVTSVVELFGAMSDAATPQTAVLRDAG